MSWDDLRSTWRGCTPPGELSEEEIMRLLEQRGGEIRRQVARRLREEAGYGVLLLGFALVASFGDLSGWTLGYLLLSGAAIGLLIGTLRHQARRMHAVDLGGNLRQTLQSLRDRVDAATRAYMSAYIVVILSLLGVLESAIVAAHRDRPALIALGAASGLVALALAWWSGRRYLESRFGHWREQLSHGLAELEHL